MARHERSVYEGNNRRKTERRSGDRRKSGRLLGLLKYVIVVAVTVLLIKILNL